MPKSKRDKRISLTKTKSKGREARASLITLIRDHVDIYDRIILISLVNSRNSKLKQVRELWKHSRLFFGKNKVMSVALGKTKESEYQTNLHELSSALIGEVGLLYTNKTMKETTAWFDDYCIPEYARSGSLATFEYVIPEGPLEHIPFSLEPQLRKLGMPTEFKKGNIVCRHKHVVCHEGDILTSEQAQVLKLFDVKMANFQVRLLGFWEKETGIFSTLKPSTDVELHCSDNSDNSE